MPHQPLTPNPQPLPWWLVGLLLPLSWLYGAGLAAYLLPYKLGIRKRHRLPCRVVSIGNLTFGGTGKSPAVRALCEGLTQRGVKPAVLSRGHGGRLCKTGAIVSDGTKRLLDASDCGDEPAALADALPGVPVAIGKDRRKVGRLLIEQFRPDVIVLDDGMQYWQLHRDVEIVLMDACRPFGTCRLLPAGDLREPARGVARADAVVITGMETVSAEQAGKRLPNVCVCLPGGVEVFLARRLPRAVIDSTTGERLPVSALKGMSIVAVSGIANPESFEAMLEECGADVRECVRFGDHCSYSKRQVEVVEESLRRTGAQAVVTTAKDAVKLRLSNMYVLDIELAIDNFSRLMDLVVGGA